MNDFLIQLIVVAVLANVVLLLAALIAPRLRRQPSPLATASPGAGVEPIGIAPVTISAAMPSSAPEPPLPASTAQGESSTDMRSDTEESQRRFRMPPEDEYPSTRSIEAFLTAGQRREDAGPDLVDDETGLETGLGWEVAVDREEKRVARYGKSVTVVVAELDRLEALAARLGSENADRLVPPVATTLRRMARAADLVARTGNARFHVLMPETDEVQAINYVERVRDACDMWLEAAAVSVRLVVGWASAGAGATIRDATRLAEQRMHADRARPSYRRDRATGGAWTGGPQSASPAPGRAPSEEGATSTADDGEAAGEDARTGADGAASGSPSSVGDRWQPGPATGPTT